MLEGSVERLIWSQNKVFMVVQSHVCFSTVEILFLSILALSTIEIALLHLLHAVSTRHLYLHLRFKTITSIVCESIHIK